MDFTLDEDQTLIVQTVRKLAEADIGPRAHDLDETETFSSEAISSLGELGLMGMMVDLDAGGSGLDAVAACAVVEEIARQDASLASVVGAHNAQALLSIAGAPSVEEGWLGRLMAGEALGAWTESEALTAEADGGGWRLSGKLPFVIGGQVAAGLVVEVPGETRRSFWVDLSADGVTRGPIAGRLGLRSAGLAHVELDRTPAQALEGAPSAAAMGRLMLASVAVGLARGALEEARAYALERKQFNKPIAQFQAIQWKIADIATQTDASRLMVQRAAHLVGQNSPDAAAAVAQARLLAADTAVQAGYEAIQIYGGNGVVREFPVERYLRDAKLLQSGFGAADEMRREVSAAHLA